MGLPPPDTTVRRVRPKAPPASNGLMSLVAGGGVEVVGDEEAVTMVDAGLERVSELPPSVYSIWKENSIGALFANCSCTSTWSTAIYDQGIR